MNKLELTGLTARPSQVWGGIRLVPLVRESPVDGLRLHREVYGGLGAVELGPRSHYTSYVPHGFVADWSGEGAQSAAYGTQFGAEDGAPARTVRLPRHRHHRLAKRRPGDRLRFLPLHLALEGYLALHFGARRPPGRSGPGRRCGTGCRRAPRTPTWGGRYAGWATRCGRSRSTRASAG